MSLLDNRLDEAIFLFNKSLTEHRNADTLKKLNEAEKALKDKKEK
jgi:stress-induced-phosphoprotein 1